MWQLNNKTIFRLIKTFLVFFFLLTPTTTLSVSKELSVPFSPQAPDGRWVEPWKTACEETSTMLVSLFYRGYSEKKVNSDLAKKKILHLVDLENSHLKINRDTNANQIISIINDFLPWEAYTVENPSLEQIKKEIDDGHPIIMPVHGRELDNKYFRTEQSYYHVFVIKGYDDETQEFITQEPATRFGLDYHYKYDTILAAMHDFLPRDNTRNGRKVAVFTRKEIIDSRNSDGDNDGLTKEQEKQYGTIAWLTDSDGDGYNDGQEVQNGYLPTVAETKLEDGTLIKIKKEPHIYVLEKGKRKQIRSVKVFRNHGWKTSDIQIVSERFLKTKLEEGAPINF